MKRPETSERRNFRAARQHVRAACAALRELSLRRERDEALWQINNARRWRAQARRELRLSDPLLRAMDRCVRPPSRRRPRVFTFTMTEADRDQWAMVTQEKSHGIP